MGTVSILAANGIDINDPKYWINPGLLDEEIEQMLEGIVDDLIVSLLTGEMFPENAREVALNIMREHMQDFNWNGNGEGGDNDDNRLRLGGRCDQGCEVRSRGISPQTVHR